MCGRYYIDAEDLSEQLRDIIRQVHERVQDTQEHAQMKLGEIYPTNLAPVIRGEAREAVLMRWGYAGFKSRVINARSETALEKPMFRPSMMERRCLIPASGYYEWRRINGRKGADKYALTRPGGTLFMAGLWREERGSGQPVFVILTRQAAPGVAFLHERMPVLLEGAGAGLWLSRAGRFVEALEQAVPPLLYTQV